MQRVMAWVLFSVEGLHCFPGAAAHADLADVRYLTHEHAHDFQFRVAIEVFHEDRDIEFHQFRRWLRSLYGADPVRFGERSCECIAADLHGVIKGRYPGRALVIEVSEDGRCGATLSFDA